MAVAYDNAANSGDMSGLTSKTWSHTTAGTNRAIVVGLAGWDAGDNIASLVVTYNGQAMAFLGMQGAANSDMAALWGLALDAVVAAGAHDVSVSNIPSGFAELGGGSVSFSGVHQGAPFGTLAKAAVATVDITLASGDMGVDILYDSQAGTGVDYPTAGANETYRVNNTFTKDAGTNRDYNMMGTEGGSGTVTMNWTDHSDNAIAAVPVKRVGTAALSGTATASITEADIV